MVGVIIQAITGRDGISWCVQQLDACRQNGLRVQGYVWCFTGASSASMATRLKMFAGSGIEALWLDVEEVGLKVTDVDRDLKLCDAYMGSLTGIYSGRWFWAKQNWARVTKWSNRLLWDSNYDGITTLDANFTPYGGWESCAIKQYRGTSAIGPVHQIDLDVMG